VRRAIAAARPPEIIDGVSALILADMCDHFREFMIERAGLNPAKLTENIGAAALTGRWRRCARLNQPWSATPAVSGARWRRTERPARMQK
jgi:hypothetical protein